MKYVFWIVLVAAVLYVFVFFFGQLQQVTITQAEAIKTQAGAIDTLGEAVKILAQAEADALRYQQQQNQMTTLFLFAALLAIGVQSAVLLGVFALVLFERYQKRHAPQPPAVLLQQARRPALPQPQPGEVYVEWPFPHYETIRSDNHEL